MIREHQIERVIHRPRSRHLGLVLAALMAAIVLASCGASGQTTPGTDAGGSQAGQGPAAAGGEEISPLLPTHFALLRAPAEGLPAEVERALRPPVQGMAWNLARRVPVSAPGRYWLVPGDRYLCLVDVLPGSPTIGTVCATVGQALHHGIVNTSVDPTTKRRTMVGVVPNGTRSVVVRTGGSDAPAPVRDGYFVVSDSIVKPPTEVILH